MALADTRFSNRRRALAARCAAQRVDMVLVTDPTNVYYLTGLASSNAAILVGKDLSARLATDGRYATAASIEAPDVPAVIRRDVGPALLEEVSGAYRIGFEAHAVNYVQLQELARAAGDNVKLIPLDGEVEKLRTQKDFLELEALREVAGIGNRAWAQLLESGVLTPGNSEKRVAAELEYLMRLEGSERTSFDTIVASGENSAKPHHSASDRVLESGDIVTIDFGAHLAGYNSDMTRTVSIGQPSSQLREIYQVVEEAHAAGIAASVAGQQAADVDAASRSIIDRAGYGEYFTHSTGHGVGLDVHEAPSANTRSVEVLAESMTLTIEPGIYVPGVGGVRIEDTLIITAGRPEIITQGSTELQVL